MSRRLSLAALVSTVALFAVGCGDDTGKGGSLEGAWEGAISCGGSGGVALAFDVEAGDESDEFDAEGLISGLVLDSVETDVEIDAIWTQPNASGPQVIEMESSCTAIQADGTSELPCEGFDELGWDGADVLEASVSNFLESGLDCDVTLNRG